MNQLTRRLAALLIFSVASASTASAAAIVHFTTPIPIPTTFAGVSVNLEDGMFTNDLAGMPGADANIFLGGEGISNDADETAMTPTWQPVRSAPNNTDAVVNLPLGTTVSSGSVTGNDFGGSVDHFATFVSGTPGYIGFSVELADTTVAYGWMRVTLQNDNTEGVIHEWAYQPSGGQIQVGQIIPEPSHTLLMCVGLATLALRRRR